MKTNVLRNKWHKHEILSKCNEAAAYLPETHIYSNERFWEMINRYQEVIIKPIQGSGGRGVMKISQDSSGEYVVHYKDQIKIIKERKELDLYLRKRQNGRQTQLIQYYIPLAKMNGKPIDFRYIVQRKKDETEWVITGRHGKAAQEGYIVTNLQKGAEVLTVEDALSSANIENLNLQKTLDQLDFLANAAAKCLSQHFEDQTIWGYDLAVDEFGKVWFIEANWAPLVGGFRYLEDLSMYNTIEWYKAYNKKMKKTL